MSNDTTTREASRTSRWGGPVRERDPGAWTPDNAFDSRKNKDVWIVKKYGVGGTVPMRSLSVEVDPAEVFPDPHLARQRLAEIVARHGGAWSTLDDGIAVHIIMMDDCEIRLSYWRFPLDTHCAPKGVGWHRSRPPPPPPRPWRERIPFELILSVAGAALGPWLLLAGFIHGCSYL